jgi:hypothetical protein
MCNRPCWVERKTAVAKAAKSAAAKTGVSTRSVAISRNWYNTAKRARERRVRAVFTFAMLI